MAHNDEFVLDLTGYKDRVGQQIEPGRYRVQVHDAELDTAKSGNKMVNIWFRVIEGDFAGSTILDRLVITDKSLFRIVGFMQAIGMPTPGKRLQLRAQAFVGKVLDIDVEDGDPYNGRVKSEVRGYLRIPKSEQEQERATGDLDGLEVFAPTEPEPENPATPITSKQVDEYAPVDLDTLNI